MVLSVAYLTLNHSLKVIVTPEMGWIYDNLENEKLIEGNDRVTTQDI